MPVEVLGYDEAMNALTEKIGPKASKRWMRKALKAGGDIMEAAFSEATAQYERTGATHEAVAEESVRVTNQGASVKVGFSKNDPKQRWRLVHLNELGYSAHGVFGNPAKTNATRSDTGLAFYKPRGFGLLQAAYDDNREKALEAQAEVIRRALK